MNSGGGGEALGFVSLSSEMREKKNLNVKSELGFGRKKKYILAKQVSTGRFRYRR